MFSESSKVKIAMIVRIRFDTKYYPWRKENENESVWSVLRVGHGGNNSLCPDGRRTEWARRHEPFKWMVWRRDVALDRDRRIGGGLAGRID